MSATGAESTEAPAVVVSLDAERVRRHMEGFDKFAEAMEGTLAWFITLQKQVEQLQQQIVVLQNQRAELSQPTYPNPITGYPPAVMPPQSVMAPPPAAAPTMVPSQVAAATAGVNPTADMAGDIAGQVASLFGGPFAGKFADMLVDKLGDKIADKRATRTVRKKSAGRKTAAKKTTQRKARA